MMLPQILKEINYHCKYCVHVRDVAERFASLCAVVGCLILDVHLLIKSSKYLLHYCAWLVALQYISDWSKLYNYTVMINWKTFVRQMQIPCISLLTVSVMLASWKCPADIRVCLSKQVPITNLDCRLYVARLGVIKLRRELLVTNESGHRRSK